MTASPGPRVVRFPWLDLAEQVGDFAVACPDAVADRDGVTFDSGRGARLVLPLAAPRARAGETARCYLDRLPGPVERQVVLLFRAAGVALGYWEGDELVQHKALRRYIVRGHGKAQPKHLESRGKSRYGSRLRLQNWQRQLGETNAWLVEAFARHGEPDRIFVAVPVRALAALSAADPAPPFARDDARVQRLPTHVFRPDFDELLRVRGWMRFGRLELSQPGAAPPGPG